MSASTTNDEAWRMLHVERAQAAGRAANEFRAHMEERAKLAPTLSPDSNGFWWLWHEGEWCPCSVETREADDSQEASAFLRLIHHSDYHAFRIRHPEALTWGGRITPPPAPK